MISFFCKKCQLDQDLNALRINEHAYSAKCGLCGVKLLRYVNDKHLDPYYRESLKMKKQRDEFAKDVIQYGDPRFELFYKNQWQAFEKQKEEFEEKKRKRKEQFEKDVKHFTQRYEREAFKKLEERLI